jgi:hypothetical protein
MSHWQSHSHPEQHNTPCDPADDEKQSTISDVPFALRGLG